METPNLSSPPAHIVDASRPSLGFPLGTALLLIIIFSLSGLFSCCYHWDKLRSLRQSYLDAEAQADSSPQKPKPSNTGLSKDEKESLPVIMPGDKIAKFIALPCPCEPPRMEKIIVQVDKPFKPPQIPVLPLY